MNTKYSRRDMLKVALVSGVVAPWLAQKATAAALPPLDPSDPTAKALSFAADTTKVDDAANPSHKTTQKCGVCAQFQGKPTDATGGCNIFAGHSVPQNGWCKVWAQKPA
jgi:High potential iron-sulfur protein